MLEMIKLIVNLGEYWLINTTQLTTKWTYSKVTQLAVWLNLNNAYLRFSFNLLCRCFSFNFGYISNCDFSFKKPLTKGNINFFSYVVTLCQTVTFIFTSNQVFVFTTPFVSIIRISTIYRLIMNPHKTT